MKKKSRKSASKSARKKKALRPKTKPSFHKSHLSAQFGGVKRITTLGLRPYAIAGMKNEN